MNPIPFWKSPLCLCGRALIADSEKRSGFCTRCRPARLVLTPAYKQRRPRRRGKS